MKPLIGITKPQSGGWVQNIAIKIAILITGGRPINLTPLNPRYDLEIDGLVLSGGTDIYPSHYQSLESKENYPYDISRDLMELRWLKAADEKRIPTLCICRGAQLLNIYFGGNLIFDIKKFFKETDYPNSTWGKLVFRKQAYVISGRLKKILKQSPIKINSLHSQAIATLGKNLKRTMIESNGITQGVEHSSHPYLLGVQFHPEFLIHRREIRKIFRVLVLKASQTV